MQWFLLQATRGNGREDEKNMEVNSGVDPFIPMCVYDAMKETRQFIDVRVCSCARSPAPCSGLLSLICDGLLYVGWPGAGCNRVLRPLPQCTR
jgi:hypothetical protein